MPTECYECFREFSPYDSEQRTCWFCMGDATCNNAGCTAQARVHDKAAGGIDDNYCEPCWRDLCDNDEEEVQMGLFLDFEYHTPA